MRPLNTLAKAGIAASLILVFSTGNTEQQLGADADLSTAPRVTINRPKPTFMQGDIVPEVTWPIREPSGAAIS